MLSAARINGHDDLILTDEGVSSFKDVTLEHGQVFSSQSIVYGLLDGNGLFNKVSPFYYKERVRLTLSVSDKSKPDFSLIRGLIEFNRPRNLAFYYDMKSRSVWIDISSSELDRLQKFLSLVFDLLVKERQFRHALKMAMEFENRYRLERDSVYGILKNTTAAMPTV